jgi:GTPase
LALKLPFFIVITKIDMVEPVVLNQTLEDLKKLLQAGAVNRKPMVVTNPEDILPLSDTMNSDRICPIFTVSSVSGQNIDKLTKFLYLLKSRNEYNSMIGGIDEPTEFDIHERFNVQGSGLVVSGTVRSGTVRVGQTLLCGPDKNRKFRPVVVKTIHVNRVNEETAPAGSFCCFSIKSKDKKEELTKDDFRKGMCLLDPALQPMPTWEFDAEILVLNHSTLIKKGYQAVLHCGVIRQTVTIKAMNKENLKARDNALIRFRFMYHPEYLKKDLTILLREGRTKILGVITNLIKENDEAPKLELIKTEEEMQEKPIGPVN